METDVLFSYCHERPSDFNQGMQSLGGEYIDMYYRRNFFFDQTTLLKSSWYFPKQDFKPKTCLRA